MEQIGDGKTSGHYTGLGIGNQFANAVLHSLRDHPWAVSRGVEGTELPIDEVTWQAVFKKEFPHKRPCKAGQMQSLEDYCKYYNGGSHGLGYNLDESFDFGEGRRDKTKQSKGIPVARTYRAVHPGRNSRVSVMEIIRRARALWDEHHGTHIKGATSKRTSRRRRADAKHHELDTLLRELADSLDADGYFDAGEIEDLRERLLREVVQRYGQRKFRDGLIAVYNGRCAVTGCDTEWVLEAAHILPYAGPNTVQNGLLLRSDIHTLFDLDLVGIDPPSLAIRLARQLKGTAYDELNGEPLTIPSDIRFQPSATALQHRWDRFTEMNRHQE